MLHAWHTGLDDAVEWCAALVKTPMIQGMLFVYEHPAEAKRWKLPGLTRLARLEVVGTTEIEGKKWMTSSIEVLEEVREAGVD